MSVGRAPGSSVDASRWEPRSATDALTGAFAAAALACATQVTSHHVTPHHSTWVPRMRGGVGWMGGTRAPPASAAYGATRTRSSNGL